MQKYCFFSNHFIYLDSNLFRSSPLLFFLRYNSDFYKSYSFFPIFAARILTDMKRAFILFIFLIVALCGLRAQKIYSTNYKSEADVKVYVTEYRSEADLIVYKTKYSSEATDNKGIWYFTQYKSEAKKKIYFTEYRSEADVKVYFTEYKSEAGWKDKSKQHLFY